METIFNINSTCPLQQDRTRLNDASIDSLIIPRLFSIGYEGKTLSRFLYELSSYQIEIIVDVRKNPISRKKGFSKNILRKNLFDIGINYQHIPQLGIPSIYRKNLHSRESYDLLFQFYKNELLNDNFIYIYKIIDLLNQYSKIALLCFESDALFCHRHLIIDAISNELGGCVFSTHI
jgi:uncharacterized protein (DUF488 family)